jgi:hypothetical protein
VIARLLQRRLRSGGDEGSALVLALIIVASIGLMLTSVLSFAGDSLTTTPKLENQRNETHYVSGAVQGAINNIRNSSVLGSTRTACPDFDPTSGSVDGADGDINVTCEPKDTSGGNQADQPNWAIHTLGTANGEGINDSSGNGLLTVDGGVYSNGRILVGGGAHNAMQVIGSAYAEATCTPLSRITTTDLLGPQCPNYNDVNHIGDDPNYTAAVANDAALTSLIASDDADPVPTCPDSGIVNFSPGYYSELPATLLANLAPSCSGAVWWFKPGKYYFDYPGTWSVETVVGGTKSARFSSSGYQSIDGNCDSDPTKPGVQFIFGGASKVTVGHKNELELCGPSASQSFTGSPQHIALFGLKGGTAPGPTNGTLAADQAPTSTVVPTFLNPGNAQTINGTSASAVIGNNQTATLNFSSITDVPKGARVTAVTLSVNSSTPTSAAASVSVHTPSTPGSQTHNIADNCTATCTVNILTDLQTPVWRDLNGLTVDYLVKGGANPAVTASIDGIALTVTYTVPKLQALQCTTGCTFFEANSPDVTVFVHGTVYTPTGGWDLQFQNKSEALFDRGVVFRTVDLNNNPSFKQTDSPFQLPTATPFFRQVLFTGYSDGVAKTRACVQYQDFAPLPGGGKAAFPGYQVLVQRWSVLRKPDGQVSPSCG